MVINVFLCIVACGRMIKDAAGKEKLKVLNSSCVHYIKYCVGCPHWASVHDTVSLGLPLVSPLVGGHPPIIDAHRPVPAPGRNQPRVVRVRAQAGQAAVRTRGQILKH